MKYDSINWMGCLIIIAGLLAMLFVFFLLFGKSGLFWFIIVLVLGVVIAIIKGKANEREDAEYKQKLATASADNPILKAQIDNMAGEEFEEYCAELLYAVGYRNIQTTPASGDNGLDVIANANGVTYGIQCKRFSSSVGVKAVQEAFAGAQYYNCDVAVVMTSNYFTKAAINMAENIGVELWDRDYIEELKKQIVERSTEGPSANNKSTENNVPENIAERESSISKVKENAEEEKSDLDYIDQSDIHKVFGDPYSYIGKHIILVGKVMNTYKEGAITTVQAWHDIENLSEDFIAYIAGSKNFNNDEIIIVDGEVEGVFRAENIFGGEIREPQIKAASITKSTYAEAVAPALETREVNKGVTEAGATLTVLKVEFAENETRIYVQVENKSGYTVNAYTSGARVVQEGKQYDADYNWKAGYPSIDRVSANASSEGIICVKALEPQKSITLHVDASSDNWDIHMNEFVITF